MAVGSSERLIDELVQQGKRNLTVIANDTAMPGTATSPTDGNPQKVSFWCSLMSINFR